MNGLYVLEGHEPRPADDIDEWSRQLESRHELYRVAFTRVGRFEVSTIFLGIDMRLGMGGRPRLFETMVFGDDRSISHQRRYATWNEAEAGHAETVAELRGLA